MIIYKATNLINNKIYIGKTVTTINKRMSQHKTDAFTYEKKTYFYKSLRKYGWDNFKWEVIDTAKSNDELVERESYWINLYNSRDSEIGYNLTNGGEGISGFKHKKETRKKMSNSHKGVKLSDEHKKSLSESRKGKTISDIAKKKISDSQKGKPRATTGESHGCAKLTEKDVIKIKKLLSKGASQREIAKLFNISKTSIANISQGKTWQHV